MSAATSGENARSLRPGDVVEVRAPSEIMATLDETGAFDGMPFMPEMTRYAGRRFTVSRRVEKICDTVAATGSRRMRDTVYLEDLRCDGSGHGGCQAGCLIYWKEAWLRLVGGEGEDASAENGGVEALDRLAREQARTVREFDDGVQEVWRCQATEALIASEPLKVSDLGQYWREFRSGNWRPLRFLILLGRALVMEVANRARLMRPTPLHGDGTHQRPEGLDLRPGQLVQVKSPAEIERTLDENGLNRRLSFDREMLPYCGGTYRVKDRVERLVDDRTGKMIRIPSDCLILEGVVCSGERSTGRWFCPRQIYPYWREAWVRPAGEPSDQEPPGQASA